VELSTPPAAAAVILGSRAALYRNRREWRMELAGRRERDELQLVPSSSDRKVSVYV